MVELAQARLIHHQQLEEAHWHLVQAPRQGLHRGHLHTARKVLPVARADHAVVNADVV